jgi:hypothetical protein
VCGRESPIMLDSLKRRTVEVAEAIAPLFAIVCLLQAAVVHAPAADFLRFLLGSALVALGMLLLFAGIDLGILPMGRFIGAELPRKGSLAPIAVVAFAIGFTTTAAEPDVLILSRQVEEASQGALGAQTLTYVIAGGVGLFAALAMARIVQGFSIRALLVIAYTVVIALSLLAPRPFVALAYDAGSVTTGVLSAPVLLALALGLSSVLSNRSPGADGFGVLGIASVGPIVAVLLLGWILQ